MLGVTALGLALLVLAAWALGQAGVSAARLRARGGAAARTRADTGMVWVLLLTAVSAACTFTGGLLQLLALVRG